MLRKMLPLLVGRPAGRLHRRRRADHARHEGCRRHLDRRQGHDALHLRPDAGGKSACNGPCATNWPPLMADGDAKASGDWTVVTRDDGGKQWAYKGKPLYTWAKDAKPGDKTGDGVNNVWHTAKD